MIKVNHIHKSFGHRDQIKVINDLNIEFPKKGLVVILGHSGSGKTTFLNILGGLETASSGDIEMFGENIKLKSEKAWKAIRSQGIGYVFQNYHLIPTLTVFENVAISLRILGYKDEAEIEKRVNYTLNAVKMLNYRGRLVTQLSGGQQQRVAIARAIAKNPQVILADEPTGNLDSKNTYQVMNIIEKIAKDKLVILVSHEKHLVKHYADRIIEVKDGVVVADYENEKSAYQFVDDQTIYLKEFNEDIKATDPKWLVQTFSDDDEVLKPYDVTMVVRNKTLYIQVEGDIKNVKLIHQDPSIMLHKQLTQQEVKANEPENDFDQSVLSHEGHIFSKKSFVTFFKTVKESFFGLFNLSKRAKIMTFIFGLMGMVLAVGVPFINNVSSERTMYVSDLPNTLYVNGVAQSAANYRLMNALSDYDDESFYINVFRLSDLVFDTPAINEANQVKLSSHLGVTKHLNDTHLLYGTLPSLPHEIAFDISLMREDYNASNSKLKQAGVWHERELIGRHIKNMYLPNEPFVVTAIVDTGAKRVYADQSAMVFLNSHENHHVLSIEYFKDNPNFVMVGRMPVSHRINGTYFEVVIPEFMLSYYSGIELHDFENDPAGFEIDFNIRAVGYYTYTDSNGLGQARLVPTDDVSMRLFQYGIGSRPFYITTNNPERTRIAIWALFRNTQISWPYEEAETQGRIFLLGLQSFLFLGVLLIFVSIACVYFMLKASMTQKVYEISVFRAIGVGRFDIAKKYIAEIFVTMTFSSLLFYVATTYVIDALQNYLAGRANYFLVDFNSFMIGVLLIYTIGLVGLIPIATLLKKNPSQLLSQYDI